MDIQWRVLGLRNAPLPDGSSDVVTWIQWGCFGHEFVEDKGVFAHQETGEINQPISGGGPFIPYVNLTESDILNWVWNSGVDKAQIETVVTENILAQIAAAPPLTAENPV